jgi:histidinol-phosphatase (PHP family)
MNRKTNFHTHTHYCDGKEAPLRYVEEAIKQSFKALGFSGHAPVPFQNGYAIPNEKISDYVFEIQALQKNFRDYLEIYLSLEMDFIPGITYSFRELKKMHSLDYTIGSVHLVGKESKEKIWFIDGGKIEEYDEGLTRVFGGDIRKGVKAYYHQINEMIETEEPDIIGHLDKIKMNNKDRYFLTNDAWYQSLLKETLALIKNKNKILEINTRGIYKNRYNDFFPGRKELKFIKEMNIPVMINTDAHKPEEIGLLWEDAKMALQSSGMESHIIFTDKEFTEVGFD